MGAQPIGSDVTHMQELYQRYVRLITEYRADILRYTQTGHLRNTLLRRCRALPFEQFEARMSALPQHPEFAFVAQRVLKAA